MNKKDIKKIIKGVRKDTLELEKQTETKASWERVLTALEKRLGIGVVGV